jgi:Fe-S cluster assembly protein SufD
MSILDTESNTDELAAQVLRPGPGEPAAGVAAGEHSHGGEQLAKNQGSKLHAFASFDAADFPAITGREEDWRFTPIAKLRGLADGSAVGDGKVVVEVAGASEVVVEQVDRSDPRVGATYTPYDRVAALAYGSFDVATVLTVPRGVRPSEPSVITRRGEGGGAAYGHLVVDVQREAEAVVVLDHQGTATYADNVEIVVGDGAQLTFVSIQDWADDAVHLGHQHVQLGRDARIKHVVVTFGGEVVRLFPSVSYSDTGGDAEFLGLYFADSGQHLEHRLYVDHAQPQCRSNVVYKGALQGATARTVWIGDVLIRPTAQGIETFELNRNLLLTRGARADSVPNLEIQTGDITGAGHASATGRFDDEQLFYLQSRGIPEGEARRLVVHGFFAELVNRIGVPELQTRLLATIEAELAATLVDPVAS